MKVLKRTGVTVDYDRSKIVNAVGMAIRETKTSEELHLIQANLVVQSVEAELNAKNVDVISTEELQNIIEHKLEEVNPEAGKRYIVYRNYRDKTRSSRKNYRLLSDEFISPYKKLASPMNQLGSFVYYRTYSRWLEEEQRREYWWETVRRAVEYNVGLDLMLSSEAAIKEAEELFDNIFNLRQFLSGRTFWVGGTQVADKYPIANYNCAFTVIDTVRNFKEVFYLLMIGSGVGVNVQKKYVNDIEPIRSSYKMIQKHYEPVPKDERQEHTSTIFVDKDMVEIIVGDSKEGWANAIDIYFQLITSNMYKKIKTIVINYNSVRPKGEVLKGFGGTASGHESLLRMFEKIDKVIKWASIREHLSTFKLKPIDCLDIANIIGQNVVSGGVRRTSEIIICDPDEVDVIEAKKNLYYLEDGAYVLNKEIDHRQMSNNTVAYDERPDRPALHRHVETMRYSGEPGWFNTKEARRRNPQAKGTNPCFRGDMKLLTVNGYETFESLDGKEVDLINYKGEISKGKVWCSGEKPIVKVKTSNSEIFCTEDHRFMLADGFECEARNLKGKQLLPYMKRQLKDDLDFIRYGYIQGDGNLGRLTSKAHKGLEVNIGKKDKDIFDLFELHDNGSRKYYINGYNQILTDLGFDSRPLPLRTLPSTFNEWTFEQKCSFMKGLFSANGCVHKGGRISFKTTSKILSEEIVTFLMSLGIEPYLTTNKECVTKFTNGEYTCKESYDVNIGQHASRVLFYENIGFYHKYKQDLLESTLLATAPTVTSVTFTNETTKVYDFNEPLTNWGVVEGVVVHNCGEILLDSKGLCNLTTINVMAFVIRTYTMRPHQFDIMDATSDVLFGATGELDLSGLLGAVRFSVRSSMRMTLVDLELPEWDKVQKAQRLLGVSLTGIQDAFNALGLDWIMKESLLVQLRDYANECAREYAEELGVNVPVLVTTIKPEGTLSQLAGVSSGVHHSHSPFFIRRVRISADDPLTQVAEELGWPVFPEVGQDPVNCVTKYVEFPCKAPSGKTKHDVSAIEQLEEYKLFMNTYVDHNCSITVHVREHEWAEVEQWIWDNWDICVGLSFLSLDDNYYAALPYEAIEEEEYNRRVKEMMPFIPSLVTKYSTKEDFDIGTSECSNGICPLR